MRLIDADELLCRLHNLHKGKWTEAERDLIYLVKLMPTTYNIDNVCRELSYHTHDYIKFINNGGIRTSKHYTAIEINDAIKIVENGRLKNE